MLNAFIGFADGAQFDKRSPSMVKFRLLLRNTAIKDEDGNEYTQEEAAELLVRALLQGRGLNVYLFRNDDDTYGGNGRINIMNLDEQEEEEEDEDKLVDKASSNGRRNSINRARSSKPSAKSSAKSSKRSKLPATTDNYYDSEDDDEELDEYGNPIGTKYFEGDDSELVVVG